MGIASKGKVLLIENSSADFYKARLPLAKYLQSRGWDVYALTPEDEYVPLIKKEEIKVISYPLDRRNKGILQLVKLVRIYRKIIRENNIDIIHSFRFQPNLLNVLTNFFNKKLVLLHLTGLGIAFSGRSFYYLFLQGISQVLFAFMFLRGNKVIVQNNEDANDIFIARLLRKKVRIIYGSGVDIAYFNKQKVDRIKVRLEWGVEPNEKVLICVTRLIWENGIKEMIDAFSVLAGSNKPYKLWIVGWADQDNPRHVSEKYIAQFSGNRMIHFLGKRENVVQLLGAADVCVYPSYYREGIPRSLLEALSMSLPVITTDMPGCNMTVESGKNGYVITPRSTSEISQAAERIINENRLEEMGIYSRQLAVNRFSNETVFSNIEIEYET